MFLETLVSRMTAGQDQVAICSSDEQITYTQLHAQALCIAHALQARQVQQDDLIAICMERSPALVVAVVGVLLSGAAYTVIESTSQDRLSGAHNAVLETLRRIRPDLVVVSCRDSVWAQGDCPCLVIPELGEERALGNPLVLPVEQAPAYVVFTSGTTGLSKGVVISHASLAHYCQSMVERLGLPAGLRYAHISPFCADLGNTSLFLALWTGGSLFVANDQERREPLCLAHALKAQQVDCLKCTPTQWRLLYAALMRDEGPGPVLQWLVLGGERLSRQLASDTLSHGLTRHLVNHYGPTETTIGATVQPVTAELLAQWSGEWVPIGRLLGQNSALIRTDTPDVVEATAGPAQGELYLAGPGLALEYRDLPDETSERFIVMPVWEQRIYLTGDRVAVDADGVLYFLGRFDRQVKVNGHRVDLDAVEMNIIDPRVGEVMVIHVRQGQQDMLLCAYEGDAQLAAELRPQLLRRLPAYMVPAAFLAMNPLPVTANGKRDERRVREHLLAQFGNHRMEAAGELLEDLVRRLFSAQLPNGEPGVDEDFFALGGNSLGAIQVVTALQLRGHTITAHAFFASPTVRGVLEILARLPQMAAPAVMLADEGPWPCSPAQQAFFEQYLAEPNRWTQVLVMEMDLAFSPERLQQALAVLVSAHPMLSAAFSPAPMGEGWCFQLTPSVTPLWRVLQVPLHSAQAVEQALIKAYAWVEAHLDIRQGRVFGAVLIQLGDGCDVLLLVAHHLVVDVISWHLLQNSLLRLYAGRLTTEAAAYPPLPFGAWCRQLHDRNRACVPTAPTSAAATEDAGLEAESQAVWIVLTREEVAQLSARNIGLDRLLLSAYAEACAALSGHAQIGMDVEGHGRGALGPGQDVYRTVGWFTSTLSLRLAPFASDGEGFLRYVDELLTAQSVQEHNSQPFVADYCFNFIGRAPHYDGASEQAWTPTAATLPPLRGEHNRRSHVLRLTAREIKGELVVDINYPAPRYQAAAMCRFAQSLRGRLLARPHISAWMAYQPWASTGNSAGVLWCVPQQLHQARRAPRPLPPPARVLLTGANGFIGIHVLAALLEQSHAEVVCLVRGQTGQDASERLSAAWTTFFPDRAWPQPRVQVLEVRMDQPRWGLAAVEWSRLAETADAIYHLAADTHLVSDGPRTVDAVLAPLHQLLALASHGGAKTLHFTSTLAVAGTCETPQRFCEDSYNIGQSFLNGYERAKYEAEGVLRRFADGGARVFIYRCGTVTGQSDSGRFQHNATRSRSVQSLRALLCLGQIPQDYDDPLVWSAVDEVANALVAVSLDPTLQGGVFHLESPNTVSTTQITAALARRGVVLTPVSVESLQALFLQSGRLQEPDVALGHFWASRPARNVQFDHQRTLTLLNEKGLGFTALDDAWLDHFLGHLIDAGTLPPGPINSTEGAAS